MPAICRCRTASATSFASSAGSLAESQTPPVSSRPQLRPWYFVIFFGLVSLFADMVYEGARSIIGPYLGTLGASAAVVGAVAGVGEFIGYGLRVASGYLVQRRGHYWTWTITGYALSVLSVPLIGSTNVIAPALLLYGTERRGKAVRSPAKDPLLSHPLDPPSSATVTTAVIWSVSSRSAVSEAARPCPPPRATTTGLLTRGPDRGEPRSWPRRRCSASQRALRQRPPSGVCHRYSPRTR